MTEIRLIITARLYEVPTICGFTKDALNIDIDDFTGYKEDKYTPAFLAALDDKIDLVRNIVNPTVLTKALKEITFRLTGEVVGLRQTMNFLEGYVNDAVGLSISKPNFGIKEVRAKITSMDVEGLDGVLSTLLSNIGNNMAALETAGYKPAMKAALEATKQQIYDDNLAQNKKLKQRSDLVEDNIEVINDLLMDIKGIWADGKILYRLSDKRKVKYYTNADILRRIRNDELHTEIMGTVTDENGLPLKNVKVVARPSVDGKRGKTVRTDDMGIYVIKGMRPVNYVFTFSLPDGRIVVDKADAVTNKKVRLDVKV